MLGSYPWIHELNDLPDNRVVAMHMRHLDNARTYNEQMEDMIDRSVARELPASELSTYDAPVL